MGINSKLRFTRQGVGFAATEAFMTLQNGVGRVASFSAKTRISLVAGLSIFGAAAVTTAPALADCATGAGTSGIISLFKQATFFLVTIGGIGAILMGVFGALVIMFSGGNTERARKGMTIVKNCIIALAIMGGIYLIRYAVVTFMGGANDAASKGAECGTANVSALNGGLTTP